MKKIVFAFLMAVASFFIINGIDFPVVSAQEIWAYTDDSNGREYYVKTETISIMEPQWLYSYEYHRYASFGYTVRVRVFKPEYNGSDIETYAFQYYGDVGVWTGDAWGRERLLDDVNHPEYYPIWEVSHQYL